MFGSIWDATVLYNSIGRLLYTDVVPVGPCHLPRSVPTALACSIRSMNDRHVASEVPPDRSCFMDACFASLVVNSAHWCATFFTILLYNDDENSVHRPCASMYWKTPVPALAPCAWVLRSRSRRILGMFGLLSESHRHIG